MTHLHIRGRKKIRMLLTNPSDRLMDPRRADDDRLAAGLEAGLVVDAAQGPGLEPCAIDNHSDRLGFRSDPEGSLGDMGQLSVLDVSAGGLELVKKVVQVDRGCNHGGLVRVGDREIGRSGDLFEL